MCNTFNRCAAHTRINNIGQLYLLRLSVRQYSIYNGFRRQEFYAFAGSCLIRLCFYCARHELHSDVLVRLGLNVATPFFSVAFSDTALTNTKHAMPLHVYDEAISVQFSGLFS